VSLESDINIMAAAVDSIVAQGHEKPQTKPFKA
jgi:hypothetical protein